MKVRILVEKWLQEFIEIDNKEYEEFKKLDWSEQFDKVKEWIYKRNLDDEYDYVDFEVKEVKEENE